MSPPLHPWMKALLWFVGGYNALAGFSMLAFYHEGYQLLGLDKPDLVMPLQLVGILVALFGVGYWMVARDPLLNRNVLVLGFWSKALGSVLGIVYVLRGQLPAVFLVVLFFADIVYLLPFFLINRHLRRLASTSLACNSQHPVENDRSAA